MDTRTGEIANLEEFQRRLGAPELKAFVRPVEMSALSERTKRLLAETGRAQIGRNSPCPCGSGKKFKRCCMTPAAGS